jgi:two-component system sensor histidine kinase ChvG
LAILFVALAPQLLVFAWSQADRGVPGRMWGTTRDVVEEASRVVGAPGDPTAELARLAAERHVRVRVFDGAGESVFEADADRPDDNFQKLEALVLGDADAPTLHDLDGTLGPELARPEVQEAERNGVYVGCTYAALVFCQGIRVARDHEGQKRIVHVQTSSRRAVQGVYALRSELLRLSLVLVPLAIALALYTGSRIVRPIEHLRRQALERATTEAPGAMLHPEQADEIGGLADSFNALLDALETKRRANESFVADLVHELKNPVAAIRATAEALEGTELGPERAERLSRVLKSSALKLDDLITQFLELARAEAGMPDEERTDVDVLALTRGLVTTMKDDPRHATVLFSFFPEDEADVLLREGAHAVVRGVSHRLEALVRELLENAASFAGERGKVDVSVRASAGEVSLRVEDSGPGIAESDRAKVFERFFTTRGRARGTGLGLSLVKAVAEAHGGSVRVTAGVGPGAAFEVRLPALDVPRELAS